MTTETQAALAAFTAATAALHNSAAQAHQTIVVGTFTDGTPAAPWAYAAEQSMRHYGLPNYTALPDEAAVFADATKAQAARDEIAASQRQLTWQVVPLAPQSDVADAAATLAAAEQGLLAATAERKAAEANALAARAEADEANALAEAHIAATPAPAESTKDDAITLAKALAEFADESGLDAPDGLADALAAYDEMNTTRISIDDIMIIADGQCYWAVDKTALAAAEKNYFKVLSSNANNPCDADIREEAAAALDSGFADRPEWMSETAEWDDIPSEIQRIAIDALLEEDEHLVSVYEAACGSVVVHKHCISNDCSTLASILYGTADDGAREWLTSLLDDDIADIEERTAAAERKWLADAIESEDDGAIEKLCDYLSAHITFDASTDEDEDTDSDGDPTCKTTTTVTVLLDGEEVCSTEIVGFFSHCCACGEQFSSWQSGDGYDHDSNYDGMEMLYRRHTGTQGDLDELVDAPAEPADPEEDDDGGYYVLYHGWEQGWQVEGQYGSRADAERAMRNKDRSIREANSKGAYGWEVSVATAMDDDDDGEPDYERDGLRLRVEDAAE
jgi:hypothetical protein